VTFVSAAGLEPLPLMSKQDVASAVVDRLERLLQSSAVHA
jgi:hypothetical protein